MITVGIDFEDFDTPRLLEWKENHSELVEEHREDLFNLAVAASADQLEHLAEKLEEISSEMKDELNQMVDETLEEGGTE